MSEKSYLIWAGVFLFLSLFICLIVWGTYDVKQAERERLAAEAEFDHDDALCEPATNDSCVSGEGGVMITIEVVDGEE